MATNNRTVTDSGYAVYSKEWNCFFGVNHCHYQHPESLCMNSTENNAHMLLATAKTYASETTWEIVEVEKSWSIK